MLQETSSDANSNPIKLRFYASKTLLTYRNCVYYQFDCFNIRLTQLYKINYDIKAFIHTNTIKF